MGDVAPNRSKTILGFEDDAAIQDPRECNRGVRASTQVGVPSYIPTPLGWAGRGEATAMTRSPSQRAEEHVLQYVRASTERAGGQGIVALTTMNELAAAVQLSPRSCFDALAGLVVDGQIKIRVHAGSQLDLRVRQAVGSVETTNQVRTG